MVPAKKDFDCVRMKHEGAEKVRELLQNMTREEELAFWAEGTQRLREEKEALSESQPTHVRRAT
jgi:hypothetical protein